MACEKGEESNSARNFEVHPNAGRAVKVGKAEKVPSRTDFNIF